MPISVKPYILWIVPKKEKPFALDLLFRALADRTRLRLLNLIADREICVCYFVEILGISQPKVSRHLAYLRKAGIVASRRDGRWMHYKLAMPQDAAAAAVLRRDISITCAINRKCGATFRGSVRPAVRRGSTKFPPELPRLHWFGRRASRRPCGRPLLLPDTEKFSNDNDLAQVIRVVVADKQSFTENRLSRAMGNSRQEICFGICEQPFHRRKIACK